MYNGLHKVTNISPPVVTQDSFLAKALALEQPLLLAHGVRWTAIEICADSLKLIKCLHRSQVLPSDGILSTSVYIFFIHAFDLVRILKAAMLLVSESHKLALLALRQSFPN